MTQFRRYESLKTYGHQECEGLDIGTVYVFPKLDGANAQIWRDENGTIFWGSRNRPIADRDPDDLMNLGHWVLGREEQLNIFFNQFPNHRLYGEWLVSHTLKTYREEEWHKFHSFDLFDDGTERYVPFDEWAPIASELEIPVVAPLAVISNPTEDQLRHRVEMNTYLIKDGCGLGEGIVAKNYDWINNYGRQTWTKIVRNSFKEKNRQEFGTMEINGAFQVEVAIAEKYVTPEFVGKVRAKIVNEYLEGVVFVPEEMGQAQRKVEATNRKQIIPRLLETVYFELIEDFLWLALKEHKNPTIDFKRLRAQSIAQTKKYAMDLF